MSQVLTESNLTNIPVEGDSARFYPGWLSYTGSWRYNYWKWKIVDSERCWIAPFHQSLDFG